MMQANKTVVTESMQSATPKKATAPSSVSIPNSNLTEIDRGTPRRFLKSGIFTISVGESKTKFQIHKDLLRAKSTYFEKLLAAEAQWAECKTNELHWDDAFEDISVDAVELWADWLYEKPIRNESVRLLLQCYKLADKYMMPKLKNDIVDSVRKSYRETKLTIHPEILQYSSELGLNYTPIHQFFLKSLVRTMLKIPWSWPTDGSVRAKLKELMGNSEMALDIADAMFEYQTEPWGNPSAKSGCLFHDHSDGSVCK